MTPPIQFLRICTEQTSQGTQFESQMNDDAIIELTDDRWYVLWSPTTIFSSQWTMTRTTGVICSSGAQIELTDDRVLWSRNKVNEVLFQKNGPKRRSEQCDTLMPTTITILEKRTEQTTVCTKHIFRWANTSWVSNKRREPYVIWGSRWFLCGINRVHRWQVVRSLVVTKSTRPFFKTMSFWLFKK